MASRGDIQRLQHQDMMHVIEPRRTMARVVIAPSVTKRRSVRRGREPIGRRMQIQLRPRNHSRNQRPLSGKNPPRRDKIHKNVW